MDNTNKLRTTKYQSTECKCLLFIYLFKKEDFLLEKMLCYLIILLSILIRISSSQETDELVECQNKNLTQSQFDQMSFNEQEQLVNKKIYFSSVANNFISLIIRKAD